MVATPTNHKATRVIGLDEQGHVLIEECGEIVATGDDLFAFVDWYGLEDIGVEERRAIGLVIH